jgi:hypothetical protein
MRLIQCALLCALEVFTSSFARVQPILLAGCSRSGTCDSFCVLDKLMFISESLSRLRRVEKNPPEPARTGRALKQA